jgi:uncharacterized protein YjbI with pentapeptide repeats
LAPRKAQSIQAPQLPKELPLAAYPRDMPTDGETFSCLDYRQLDLAERTISRLHFEAVFVAQMIATGSHLDYLRVEDVRFTSCNLTNAAWSKLGCARAEFIGCRMTGFTTLEAVFHDTVFKDCKVDLAQFYQAKMHRVRFEDCLLTEADFRAANLTGLVFARCDLSNADFTGATLEGADLRGCQIDGMRAGPTELRGAIIDEVQALALVRAMGITVSTGTA